jgi:ABC-type antimicrobial peptide transport system permease subunit
LGWSASLALMHFARSLLLGIQPTHALVIGTAMAVFIVAALIAGGLPARRAAAIDPVVVRHE